MTLRSNTFRDLGSECDGADRPFENLKHGINTLLCDRIVVADESDEAVQNPKLVYT